MKLYVIGTGPGSIDHMSCRAVEILKQVECVAGYTTYIKLVEELIKNKELISTGMMKEVERVKKAIEQAMAGKSCALISGGDSGIYAMAGLVFDICMHKKINIIRGATGSTPFDNNSLLLEIIPGIPALAAGAAIVGAPLTHDFAAVSLSDLLTPWEKIQKRLTHAAIADFVIVLYNPKSKKRNWQLKRARELILEHREGSTPVGIVTGAMRENQALSFTTLDKLDTADIGMQTVVFIGSSASLRYMDFMFTPRGYTKKYEI
ncbi:MAG: precorrin-3B C(17)-methyltransferase [Desulfobacula sp.]|nr:precorrin-3B C(17)-methyltransferase [Desulfobacula sp.]